MKNITLSAQDDKIDSLRRIAKSENKTVNDLFREWLDKTIAHREKRLREKQLRDFRESVRSINYVKLDRKYTREEMNER